MSLFKMLKHNSKLALSGNWGRAILVLVILLAAVGILSGVQQYLLDLSMNNFIESIPAPSAEIAILSVFTLLTIIIALPLEIGVYRWFYLLIRGTPAPISEIFVFFESFRNYVKSIWLYVCILTRSILWSALFFAIPSAAGWFSAGLVNGRYVFLVSGDARLNSAVGTIGVTLSILLFILASVLFIIWMNRYTLAMYILFDDMDAEAGFRMSVSEIIKTSVRYSKGYRLGMFLLCLSFIGWILLSILIVPLFFVIPYFVTTVTMYSRYIIEKNQSSVPRDTNGEPECSTEDMVLDEPTARIPQPEGDTQ